MHLLHEQRRFRFIYVGMLALALTIGTLTIAYSGQKQTSDLWLSYLVGEDVVVGFIVIPPDLSQFVRVQLVAADYAGIVLKFTNNDVVFFSYANIMTVEPAPN